MSSQNITPSPEPLDSDSTETQEPIIQEMPESPLIGTTTDGIIRGLDDTTDQIFTLRSSLASIYPEIAPYLPRDAQGNRIYLDGIVEMVNQGKDLDSIIQWSRLNGSAETESEEQKDDIRATFSVAIEKQRALNSLGGAFVGDHGRNDEEQDIAKYYRYRLGEFVGSMGKIAKLETKMDEVEEKKKLAARRAVKAPSQEINIHKQKNYNREQREISALIKEIRDTPEGYLYIYGRRLNNMKNCLDNGGRIVETPYVQSKINGIIRELENGRPVFIHGELGSGKTELAKHIARKMIIENWEEQNPKPTDPDEAAQWEVEKNRMLQVDPYVISGHRGLEPEVLTGARTIERVEAPLPEEQIAIINERWKAWKEAHPNSNDSDKKIFEEAYIESFRSPVEVHTQLGPFMKAMEEGRPVIIDEMNAIPHTVLIMLNDMLTRKVGETITPPIVGSSPITIKKGFCVMATGNYKPEDGLMYVGRQALDAAFISRYKLEDYDYLPNNISLEPEDLSDEDTREWRQRNELMGMLVAKMMNKNLSVTAPEDAFRQLEKLAFIARNIQDIFSGKEVGQAWEGKGQTGSSVSPKELLKENVLSIRHLIPLIDRWKNEGYSRPLDYYLFSEYVARSGARPEEKIYLYGILQTMGDFFHTSEGWPSYEDRRGVLELNERTFEERLLNIPKIRTYGAIEVIERLFGVRPKRVPGSVPKSVFEIPAQKDISAADRLERKRLVANIRKLVSDLLPEDGE